MSDKEPRRLGDVYSTRSVGRKLVEGGKDDHGWEKYSRPFNQQDPFEYDRDDEEKIPIDQKFEDNLMEEERFLREQRARHRVQFARIAGEAAEAARRRLEFNPTTLGDRPISRRMAIASNQI
ncbi:hypothetical protein GOP47_0009737 [Adiantum capillus-veneris]|uniref:Uncharacterized protein n=1 Tax=Adiantum capillus-veneris TaxID=13818 RepID=A0A9D4UX64_ADICA|nr:hypothetical protein GOP47_0009737 [Adiantum capillus-veneris]